MITETAPSALSSIRGYWLWLARGLWLLIALLCIVLFVLGIVAQYERLREPCRVLPVDEQSSCLYTENALAQRRLTWDDFANFYTPISIVATLPIMLIGFLVFWRKSETMIGLLFSLVLMTAAVGAIPNLLTILFFEFPGLRMPVELVAFLINMAPAIVVSLFPDGRFVPRWTRWWLILWTGLVLGNELSFVLLPSFADLLWRQFFGPALVLMWIAAIYAMIYRYRHNTNLLQRQQIKWVMIAMITAMIFRIGFIIMRQFWRPGFYDVFLRMVYEPLWYLCMLFAVVCLGISISRYRLWDIDILINRALVYSLLTAVVVGLYVIVVGVLGTTIQGHGNLLVSVLATGLVAVLVQPLRDILQRCINRLMYGERDDPVTVLSRLGQRLEATIALDSVLPALTQTIAQTLKLPYVAVTRGADSKQEVAAAYGQPAGELVRLPLTHQGETMGQLVVAPRSLGEAFSPADHHLLKNIAHQAGMAVYAVSLTADLQRSRQRLVTMREEERRRLRRDLHDGLGPNLASQGLKLAAVKQLAKRDRASAILLLEQVMAQNHSTVEEVRRLVYGLRPPALDELGLVAAIRDYVSVMDGKSTLQIEVTSPSQGLPPLSAAVEVAAYRIILEALTNVIRHAQAKHCMIRFSLDQKDSGHNLQIEIQDDGIGLASTRRAGVGTSSMRERAEELGGTCVIESGIGRGTRVCVKIPVMAA